MKKVARMRMSPTNMNEETNNNQNAPAQAAHMGSEPIVRTTGRIKKPKAVFDPSDNYLPRSQRPVNTGVTMALQHCNSSSSLERRASSTKSSNISPVNSIDPKDACYACKKKESKRPAFANKNPLIQCLECQRRIHKLCLKVDFDDFDYLQNNYKCDQCSTCRICKLAFNNPEEEMITCSKCIKYFHIFCFPTKIAKTDNLRNWKCNKCQVNNQITNGTTLPVKKIREIIGDGDSPGHVTHLKSTTTVMENTSDTNININTYSILPKQKRLAEEHHLNDCSKKQGTSNDESIPPTEKRTKLSNKSDTVSVETNSSNAPLKSDSTNLCYSPNEHFDDIPDVKEWTVDQVYEYFFKHFPKEAQVFKDEEIDGRSLLLLKRSDVVKKLPIKLGPSLRIYSVILKIQAQLNDPTLGWNCGL